MLEINARTAKRNRESLSAVGSKMGKIAKGIGKAIMPNRGMQKAMIPGVKTKFPNVLSINRGINRGIKPISPLTRQKNTLEKMMPTPKKGIQPLGKKMPAKVAPKIKSYGDAGYKPSNGIGVGY